MKWLFDDEDVDFEMLSHLYKVAPRLGKSIISKLVVLSSGHKKIILYSHPNKEAFYKKLGFKHMSTAMAIFENQNQVLDV